jgi:hypothetical protein
MKRISTATLLILSFHAISCPDITGSFVVEIQQSLDEGVSSFIITEDTAKYILTENKITSRLLKLDEDATLSLDIKPSCKNNTLVLAYKLRDILFTDPNMSQEDRDMLTEVMISEMNQTKTRYRLEKDVLHISDNNMQMTIKCNKL